MKSAILCYSGGLDSTVLLYSLRSQGYKVRCLSVDYGQRHKRELTFASFLCNEIGVEHQIADLSGLNRLFAGSSQTSKEIDVPEGHYAEETMKATVVPNRNMVLLSLAGAWAVSTKSDYIAYAAHSGDHAIYPDCRPEFTSAMSEALRLCDWQHIELLTPFLYPKSMSKTDVVKLGATLSVPFELTWSCYKGGKEHCGRCSTCLERREAFNVAKVVDPTKYIDAEYYGELQGKGVIQ
jgi:7-cyano-7-deazaguanine synthase